MVTDSDDPGDSTGGEAAPGAASCLTGFSLTNATGVTVLCDQTTLFLQGPDAPLGSYWTRR